MKGLRKLFYETYIETKSTKKTKKTSKTKGKGK